MNSGLKDLPKGLRRSILAKIKARMFNFRDRTLTSLIALTCNTFSARDVRRTLTDCDIFSAPMYCVSLL